MRECRWIAKKSINLMFRSVTVSATCISQKENNRTLVKAVPVATALSHFPWLDAFQSPLFACRGISAPLVLLHTTRVVHGLNRLRQKKCASSQTHTELGKSPVSKSKWMHVLPRCTKKREEKGPHARGRIRPVLNGKGRSLPYTNKLSCIIQGLCSQGWVQLF